MMKRSENTKITFYCNTDNTTEFNIDKRAWCINKGKVYTLNKSYSDITLLYLSQHTHINIL